jgi:NitT/TauT family transport system ATP-binding protein
MMTVPAVARTAKLAVRNISKTFRVAGDDKTFRLLPVLRNVNFEVFETEIVSLIGESGSGKTTMLRIVQGLIKADSGEIAVGGKAIRGPGYDRGIVFQQANLLPWLNARSNVEFGLDLKGVPKAQRVARARDLLELVGLGDFANQYPHQLSGGMQQRIGVARALAIDPEILLMDEPFSALDAQTRESLQHELLAIHAKTRKTILFVTHDLDEAVYLSDRVIVMGARPGHVKDVIDVPFPRPRPSLPEMRGDLRFLELRDHIWQRIRPHAAPDAS